MKQVSKVFGQKDASSPIKVPLPVEDLDFRLTDGSFAHTSLHPNRLTICSSVFVQHIRVTETKTGASKQGEHGSAAAAPTFGEGEQCCPVSLLI